MIVCYLAERQGASVMRELHSCTEIKATVNPTNTLVTYNKNSTDKTTQNSDNVIDKTI